MSGGFYLGVDGGGTKTAFLILDENGIERGRCEGGTSYHPQIGMDGLRRVLAEGIGAVTAQAGVAPDQLAYAFFGLPAHGEDSRVAAVLDAVPREVLGHDRYACGNDMVCGWAGSLACADGINIVAGTGSIGYGERQGRAARCGGWGELFGDEGSGYWIAVQGLNAFTRMSDGRLTRGPLYGMIRETFSLAEDLDLSGLLTGNAETARDSVAALSRLVVAAVDQGDDAARQILAAAAGELVKVVDAIARDLAFAPDETIPVSYSGGVFRSGEAVLRPFAAALDASPLDFALQTPSFDPTVGAALYAANRADAALTVRMIAGLSARG